jgi:hypothetical protein
MGVAPVEGEEAGEGSPVAEGGEGASSVEQAAGSSNQGRRRPRKQMRPTIASHALDVTYAPL